LRVTTPKEIKLRAAFESLGYKVLRGYVESDTLKSNAPPAVLFDILKTYVNINNIFQRKKWL
jgi:hypothetical protein